LFETLGSSTENSNSSLSYKILPILLHHELYKIGTDSTANVISSQANALPQRWGCKLSNGSSHRFAVKIDKDHFVGGTSDFSERYFGTGASSQDKCILCGTRRTALQAMENACATACEMLRRMVAQPLTSLRSLRLFVTVR
jgi:hypothetical protein